MARIFTVVPDPRIYVVSTNNMAAFYSLKDPQSKLDYYIDWTEWLVSGDAIASSTWTCTDTNIVISSATGSTNGTSTVWLSAGIAGEVYDVVNTVITTGTRTDQRTIEFTLFQR